MLQAPSILVVEDEPNDRILIEEAFRWAAPDAQVHFVQEGSQAIAYLSGEGPYSDRARYPFPTLITTDLRMPGMDGFALIEHLKSNPAWAAFPIVVLSGSTHPGDIQRAYLLGVSSFHQKPNNFSELRKQIQLLCAYWCTCELPKIDPVIWGSVPVANAAPANDLSALRVSQ